MAHRPRSQSHHSRIARRAIVPVLAVSLALATTASAHDFWVIPDVFAFAPDSVIHLSGRAGTRFPAGTAVQPARVADARLIGAMSQTKITQLSVEGNSLRLHERPPAAGQYVVAVTLTSTPTRSTTAGMLRFLRLEGGAAEAARLDATNALAGQDSITFQATSYATAIIQVGRGGPRAFAVSTGVPLEFVPVNDPGHLHVGDTLHLKVVGGGTPVANIGVYGGPAIDSATAAGVSAHAPSGANTSLTLATDADGVLHVPLTAAGAWNLRSAWVYHRAGAQPSEWSIARTTYVFGVGPSHAH